MDKSEAIAAVEFNAICEYKGMMYYAFGNQRIKYPDKPFAESIILHDIEANSITYASIEATKIVDWKSPMWLVEHRLAQIRARQERTERRINNNENISD